MSLVTPHRCPIHCILPPHILENIVATTTNGNLRQMALSSLSLNNTLTNARTGFAESNRRGLALRRQARLARPFASSGLAPFQPQRTIYDASSSPYRLPGQVTRTEGAPPTSDLHVNQAYDGLGATFNLYAEQYNRNSIDGAGLPLLGTVHYGVKYDNAFWNGKQMIFGDGDGVTFNTFTTPVDIQGHELTHGVTQYESNLVYMGEIGALNESCSDVFGSLVKQYQNKQSAAAADWLIAAGLFVGYPTQALRSLKAPGTAYDNPAMGTDPQPANIKDYVRMLGDNGGVHVNSGIPNHAFYLIATALGGNAWETPGQIWYASITDPRLTSTAKFQDFANLTLEITAENFGVNSNEYNAVRDGWAGVGISASSSTQTQVGAGLAYA